MSPIDHVLDNLAWHALTGPHAEFAEGGTGALQYRRSVALFSGTATLDERGWRALAEMAGPGRTVVLFQPGVGAPPDGFEELFRSTALQMVADDARPIAPLGGADELVELGADDAAEMIELVELTEPGPFFPETYRLGTYLGVRENGRLIAMAGERMQASEASEISAVCTHPDARRRGLAARLTTAMMAVIRDRGQVPLLHVEPGNTGAIAVYEQLGFRVRCHVDVMAARVTAEEP